MNDHTPDSDSKPKSRPRLFSWSLRYFLIFFTLVSISSGWWITRAQKQRAAVAKIQKLGGDVEYSTSHSAEWLNDLLGVDYVQTVTRVQFDQLHLGRDAFHHLADCQQLKIIALGDCTFEGESLSELSRPSLKLDTLFMVNCRPAMPFVGDTTSKAWKLTPSEPTFNFEGGDPEFYTAPIPGDNEFPNEEYEVWKKEILPGVEVFDIFIS